MTITLSEYLGYCVRFPDGTYYRNCRQKSDTLLTAMVFILKEDAEFYCGIDGQVERLVDRTTRTTFALSPDT